MDIHFHNIGDLQTHEKVVKTVNKDFGILAKITMIVKKNPTQPLYYILIYNWNEKINQEQKSVKLKTF